MQLVNGNNIPGKSDENYSSQLIVSRFRNLGKEKFQSYVNFEVNPIEFIKECSVNYAINIPPEINEFIITSDTVPLVWLSDLPVFASINEFLRKEGLAKGDFSANLNEIKKFFSKWILTKSEKERQFFSTTALNLIEKDAFQFNYQKYVYKALLIAFDRRIANVDAAVNSMQLAINAISELGLNETVNNEITYLNYLTLGFIYFKCGLETDAIQTFETVRNIRSNGATAILYNALSAKIEGNIGGCVESLRSLLELDQKRFEYALRINKIEAFNFFLKNSYAYQIVKESRFADLYNEIDGLYNSYYSLEENVMYKISLMYSELEELRLKNFYTDIINQQLNFINLFVDKYRNSQNFIVLMMARMVKEKFISVTEQILEAIKSQKLADMSERLHIYDIQLKDANHSMKNLKDSGGRRREKLNEQLNENIVLLQDEYKDKVSHAEKLIKNLENSNKFDSGKAFSTTMFYNFVISVFIFIIGGIGSGMISGSAGLKMNQFMMNGVKWGGIAFVLGIFAAVYSSFNMINEKSKEKARLKRFLEKMKQEQEGMVSKFKEDNTERIKIFDENYSAEVNKEEIRLNKLRQEKDAKFKIFNDRVENEISEYREQINKIINV